MRPLTFVCVAGALLILSLVTTGGFLPRAVRAPLAAILRGPCNSLTTTTGRLHHFWECPVAQAVVAASAGSPAKSNCNTSTLLPLRRPRRHVWGGAGRVRQGRRNGLLPVHAMRSLTFVCVAGALLTLSLVATGGFLPHAVRAPLAAVQRGPCNTRTTTTTPGPATRPGTVTAIGAASLAGGASPAAALPHRTAAVAWSATKQHTATRTHSHTRHVHKPTHTWLHSVLGSHVQHCRGRHALLVCLEHLAAAWHGRQGQQSVAAAV
jgi:hypothetical protein